MSLSVNPSVAFSNISQIEVKTYFRGNLKRNAEEIISLIADDIWQKQAWKSERVQHKSFATTGRGSAERKVGV